MSGTELAVIRPHGVSLTQVQPFDHTAKAVRVVEDVSIWELLEKHNYAKWNDDKAAYDRIGTFVVNVNGKWLVAGDGDYDYVTQAGDIVRIERVAGKGGGGGSKGLGIIIAIVAIVLAPFTGGASLYLLAVSAALVMSGMAGVPKPAASANSGKDGASPTYSLTPQGNQGRLLSAVPKLYGTVKFTPDLASQPYTEFVGNDQYLYELFALTCGECDVEAMYIDETLLTAFPEVTTQIIRPYGQVTLFPDNVVTSDAVQGIQLENGVVAGWYVVGLPGTITTRLGFDFVFPGGCYRVDNDGNLQSSGVEITVRYQQVNDQGVPFGPVTTGVEVLGFATRTPQRVTRILDVAPGRYQTAVTISGPDPKLDTKIQNGLQWGSLRAYLKADPNSNYGNVTLIALRMKSSEVLNSNTARKFSVKATGKTRRWNSISGWGQYVANNSIAWAAADILHDNDYGRGLPTDRIDMAGLQRLENVWASRGDTFNGLFDTTISIWDAVTKVCRAGRTIPMYYAGRIEFVRDEPQYLPVAMFQPHNIIQGSFSVDHNWPTNSTPDYVVIQYMDKTTWSTKQVDCKLPNVVSKKAAQIELFGVTDRDQAYREGMFIAAGNRLRRRTIRFSTEMEGQVLRYNDLIQISHDVAAWGYSGVVLAFDRQSGRIRTSEPIPMTAGRMVIAFRRKDGSADGPYPITADPTLPVGEFGGIVGGKLADRQAVYISKGVNEDSLTMYQFGPVGKAGLLALVTKVKPRGEDKYNIECIGDVPSIHYAENGGTVPFPESPSNLVRPPVGPIVDRITVTDTVEPGQQAVQFSPAIGATYYEVEYELNGGAWATMFAATVVTQFLIQLPRGNHGVRVRGVGTLPGPWATWYGEVRGTVLGLPTLRTFTATPQLLAVDLDWTFGDDTIMIADFTTVIVSSSPIPGPGNSQILGQFPYPINHARWAIKDPSQKFYFFAAVTDKAGRQGPFFNDMTAVVGESDQNPEALLQLLNEQIGLSQLTQQFREKIESIIVDQDGLQTAVQVITEQMTTDREATVRYIQQIEAQAGQDRQATAQMFQQVQADIDGALSSMITMRAQVRADGKLTTAGIGIGVVPDFNDPTQHNSEIILQAGRIAFTTSQLDDPLVTPLVVQGNAVYMHGAFIANLTVNTAQIADVAISTAKIQFLAVTTLKIAGQAITVPRYAKLPGETGKGYMNWFKLIDIDITLPEYNGTFIIFSCGLNTNGIQQYGMRMLINGTVVSTVLSNWSETSLNLSWGDYFNAGTQIVEIQVYGADANVKFFSPNLLVQGAMR